MVAQAQVPGGWRTYVYEGRVDVVCVLLAPFHGENHSVEVICKSTPRLAHKHSRLAHLLPRPHASPTHGPLPSPGQSQLPGRPLTQGKETAWAAAPTPTGSQQATAFWTPRWSLL